MIQAARRWISPERSLALALFLGFWILYYLTIGVETPNLYWYNFIFDADPSRILDDALTGQNPGVFARHPLFALCIGTLSSLFAAGLGPRESVLAAVSCFAAAGVAASFVYFRTVVGQNLAALCFSLLYGSAATVWLLSAIPETFAVNSAIIVGTLLLHRPEFGQPLRHRIRFGLNALLGALAMGMVVTNVVYSVLGFASNLRRAQQSFRRRLAVLLAFCATTYVLFAALGAIQGVAFFAESGGQQVVGAPLAAVDGDQWLSLDRRFVPGEAAQLLRAFVVDNLVAPPPVLEVVHTREGALQMLQFGDGVAPLYLLALLTVLVFILTTAWHARLRDFLREHPVQLAVAFIGYDLIFYFFYRANGQPFIFSIHSVFPVLVLLAHWYAKSSFRWRAPCLAAATFATAANNVSFIGFVRSALGAECEQRLGNVCLTWRGHGGEDRFTRGIAEHLVSADYLFDQGRAAVAQRLFEEGVPLFRRALELDPEHLGAAIYLGYALLQTTRLDQATQHLERALVRHPADPDLTRLLEDAKRRPR